MAKTILEILKGKIKPTKGDYGVEIEMEGENFLPVGNGWALEHDGSLRAGGVEYVLKVPGSVDEVEDKIKFLYNKLKAGGAVVNESYMAGVHVHVNVQSLSISQLFTFFTTYLMLEKALVKWCGEFREGNHFCLRSSDAEFILDKVLESLEARSLKGLHDMNIRYSSFNFCSLFKYGSVEFRAMRSTKSPKPIIDWVKILDTVKNNSLKYNSPVEVVGAMSMHGPDRFASNILGPWHNLYRYDGSAKDLIECMRIAQDVAFGFDWDSLNKQPNNLNPFQKKENEKEF